MQPEHVLLGPVRLMILTLAMLMPAAQQEPEGTDCLMQWALQHAVAGLGAVNVTTEGKGAGYSTHSTLP
jgi:hypothetical protein